MLPDDNGFLLNHIWGKTLGDGTSNLFGLWQHPNSTLGPVKAKEEYVAFAWRLGVSLTQGYLFRPTDQKGHVVDKPLSSAAAEHQFKLHLKKPALTPGRLSTASTQGGPHPGLFGLRIGRPYEACRMVLPRYSWVLPQAG